MPVRIVRSIDLQQAGEDWNISLSLRFADIVSNPQELGEANLC